MNSPAAKYTPGLVRDMSEPGAVAPQAPLEEKEAPVAGSEPLAEEAHVAGSEPDNLSCGAASSSGSSLTLRAEEGGWADVHDDVEALQTSPVQSLPPLMQVYACGPHGWCPVYVMPVPQERPGPLRSDVVIPRTVKDAVLAYGPGGRNILCQFCLLGRNCKVVGQKVVGYFCGSCQMRMAHCGENHCQGGSPVCTKVVIMSTLAQRSRVCVDCHQYKQPHGKAARPTASGTWPVRAPTADGFPPLAAAKAAAVSGRRRR